MKHSFFILFLLLASKIGFSQEHTIHTIKYIFDPKANARHDLDSAISVAATQHKHVFILVGGDWSDWSVNFLHTLEKEYVQKLLADNYVFIKINFTPSNKNEDVLKQLESPKYEGYPIIIVLDETGKKLVAQNSDDFKISPQVYFAPKVEKFLRTWAASPPQKK